jgi:hypothetical protein
MGELMTLHRLTNGRNAKQSDKASVIVVHDGDPTIGVQHVSHGNSNNLYPCKASEDQGIVHGQIGKYCRLGSHLKQNLIAQRSALAEIIRRLLCSFCGFYPLVAVVTVVTIIMIQKAV